MKGTGGTTVSQIASFYLLKDGQRQELSNGDCSGVVYMAIWDWCDNELDIDVNMKKRLDSIFLRVLYNV